MPTGAIAQLGERLLCKQEVTGSIPVGSTSTPVSRNLVPSAPLVRFAVSFIRLLFNNSEEARRVRFVLLSRTHLGMRLHYLHLRQVAAMQPSAPVTAETAQAALRVIGSSEKVHVVDALATTGDEGRCSLR